MPLTDPIPDEDIKEGFATLLSHQITGQGHADIHHLPLRPQHPHPHPHNEDAKDHPATETAKIAINDNNPTEIEAEAEEPFKINLSHSRLSPTPSDLDFFLLNKTQQSVPLQSQLSKTIVDILNPGHFPQSVHDNPPVNVGDTSERKPVDGQQEKNRAKPHGLKNTSVSLFVDLHKHPAPNHLHGIEDASELNIRDVRRKQSVVNNEVLERALIAQWPPPDQVHHNRVDAYEQLQECGHTGGHERIGPGRQTRRGFISWFSPSIWLERQWYKVSTNLKTDWRFQAGFFAKVILVKAVQLLVINLWILLVGLNSGIRQFVINTHNWIYLPLALFLMILISVRIVSKSRAGWHTVLCVALLIVVTILLAYPLAAVTFAYKAYCIPMVTGTLLLTCLSLAFVPFMTQSPITKPTVIRTGAVLLLVYSVLILVIVAYAKLVPNMAQFTTLIFLPGLMMAEIVLWVTIYEIQRILGGFSFNVSERRWAFTALYV